MSVSNRNAHSDPQQSTDKKSSDGHILMHTLHDVADFASMAGTKAPTLRSDRRHNSNTLRDEAIS
jgi:hypothetical protein